ncbi:hypothetical protein Leryth_025348 [Lithospermum erythrorhizon]|nr:hypothetical protein Leryth_025348 [Lithospermum erythrorhizon]
MRIQCSKMFVRFNMNFSASSPVQLSTTSTIQPRCNLKYSDNSSSSFSSPPLIIQSQPPDQECSKTKTIRYRLSQLCKEGKIELAHNLFDTIPKPTTVLWNTIIIGFICNNLPEKAIQFYSKMKHISTNKCDPYTYSATLKACSETNRISVGKAVHGHIIRLEKFPSKIVYNSLLNMYASCLLRSEDEVGYDLVERVFWTMSKRNVVSWNVMISWYVKRHRFDKAVRQFVKMMRMGIRPTIVSFVNVFPAVSRGGFDVATASVVYALVVKLGSEFVNDLFVVSSAILMYADIGCLGLARKIFDTCLEKNIEVWNSLIGGYVQNNRPLDALNLFMEAISEKDSIVLDEVTFLSVLNAASQLQEVDFARQIHAYLVKNSLISRVVLSNAVVSLYSKCNCINDSFQLFNEMHERDVVSWNTMVTALVQNGLDFEGVMLVFEMQKQGFTIDTVTFTALLSAASNLRDLGMGKQVHSYLLRHCIQFEGMETYLIDMYSKSGMIEAAQEVFNAGCSNEVDQATWNAMISGNTQNGLINQSFNIFRQMIHQGTTPNSVTLASILPACSQFGGVALGKAMHGFAIRNFLNENIFVASALIDMYSKSGSVLYAERVFKISPEKNAVTYTNMILGYGQHGMGEIAVKLFYYMKELQMMPDAVTLVAVLSACSYSGLVEEGLHIYKLMETEYDIKPLLEHHACIVDMLGRVGRVNEAYEFIKELGEDIDLLRIWGSLLSACQIHGHYELGKVVADKLIEMEVRDGVTGYHVLLSNIFADERNWELVNTIRRGMQEKGLSKEVGCSWIDINGYPHSFTSREKRHPQCDEIYSLLDKLVCNMKDAGYRLSHDYHLA